MAGWHWFLVYASTETADVKDTDARRNMVERVSRQLDALTDGHRKGGNPAPVYAVIVYTGDAEESPTDSANQEPTPPNWHIREVHLHDLNGSYDRESPEKPAAANPRSSMRGDGTRTRCNSTQAPIPKFCTQA